MSGSLFLRDRQRRQQLDARHLRRIILSLLVEELHCETFELGVFLVGENAMVRLNEKYLRHAGCTDVIAFDYCEGGLLAGDVFVCVPEAVRQARKFRTSWQSELVRYLVHGILHLRGFDDQNARHRRRMKAAEDRLVRALDNRFVFQRLGRRSGSRKCIGSSCAATGRTRTVPSGGS